MNYLLEHTYLQSLGWTLLHACWQGCLVALIWAITQIFLSQSSPQKRYLASMGALFTLLLCSILTFWQLLPDQPQGIALEPISLASIESSPLLQTPLFDKITTIESDRSWRDLLNDLTPWFSLAWMLGAALMGLRFSGGLWYIQQLKTKELSPLSTNWELRAEKIAKKMGIQKKWQVMESRLVSEPLTIGYAKNLILIPAGILSGLSPEQVEAILAHEFAHIHRADYFFNLLQSLIEILFFFHPAVWWLSREIRRERELCCDDLAVAKLGDAYTYAEALTQLQLFRHSPQHFLSMKAKGKSGNFTARIQRLFQSKRKGSPWKSISAAILLCLALVGSAYYGYTKSQEKEAISQPSSVLTEPHVPKESSTPTTKEVKSLLKDYEQKAEITSSIGEEDSIYYWDNAAPLEPMNLQTQELESLYIDSQQDEIGNFLPNSKTAKQELLAEYFIEPDLSEEEFYRIQKEIHEFDNSLYLLFRKNDNGLIDEVFLWGWHKASKNSTTKYYKTGLKNFSKAHIRVFKTSTDKPILSLKDPLGNPYWTDKLEQETLEMNIGDNDDKLSDWITKQNTRGANIEIEELNLHPTTGELVSYKLSTRSKITFLPSTEVLLYSGKDYILLRTAVSSPKEFKLKHRKRPQRTKAISASVIKQLGSPPALIYLDGKAIDILQNSNDLQNQLIQKGYLASKEEIENISLYVIQDGNIEDVLKQENLAYPEHLFLNQSIPSKMNLYLFESKKNLGLDSEGNKQSTKQNKALLYFDGKYQGRFSGNAEGLFSTLIQTRKIQDVHDLGTAHMMLVRPAKFERLLQDQKLESPGPPNQQIVNEDGNLYFFITESWEYMAERFDKGGQKKERRYMFEGHSQGFRKGYVHEVVREICDKKEIPFHYISSRVLTDHEAWEKYKIRAVEVVDIRIKRTSEAAKIESIPKSILELLILKPATSVAEFNRFSRRVRESSQQDIQVVRDEEGKIKEFFLIHEENNRFFKKGVSNFEKIHLILEKESEGVTSFRWKVEEKDEIWVRELDYQYIQIFPQDDIQKLTSWIEEVNQTYDLEYKIKAYEEKNGKLDLIHISNRSGSHMSTLPTEIRFLLDEKGELLFAGVKPVNQATVKAEPLQISINKRRDYFEIRYDTPKAVDAFVSIEDMQGKKVLNMAKITFKPELKTFVLPLRNFENGTYKVSLDFGDKVLQKNYTLIK
ncbi:MAG: M56 family metallopeptidase [Bacteroidota bacterium]